MPARWGPREAVGTVPAGDAIWGCARGPMGGPVDAMAAAWAGPAVPTRAGCDGIGVIASSPSLLFLWYSRRLRRRLGGCSWTIGVQHAGNDGPAGRSAAPMAINGRIPEAPEQPIGVVGLASAVVSDLHSRRWGASVGASSGASRRWTALFGSFRSNKGGAGDARDGGGSGDSMDGCGNAARAVAAADAVARLCC